jgi:hypothetical protein
MVICILGIGLCCLLALAANAGGKPVLAQSSPVTTGRGWTPVAAIPQFAPDALPPYMVVDENRTVHAFASMPLSDDPNDSAYSERGIFYRQWTAAGGWTPVNDIVLTPLKQQARIKDVFLDKAGVIHLVFFGGDEQEANIYYTWAPAAEAGSAHAWAEPLVIGPKATTPEIAALTGDGENELVALYAGNLGEGNSLYVTYSDDAGATWSDPATLFSTYSLDNKVFDFDWHLGESGRLYAVWNVTNKNGQNVAGYYTKLEHLSEQKWTEPVEFDKNVGLGIAVPAVTEYNGGVMLMYNNGLEGAVAPVMWFTQSRDGGNRFTDPMRPFPDHFGRNGVISFVEDGGRTLHVFWGQRIPGAYGENLDMHGMWHSTWDGGTWRPPEPVVSGPISTTFDPYDARAVAVQGNVILVTWRTDPGRDVSSTWYSSTALDLPELPVKPLPVPLHAQSGVPADVAATMQGGADMSATSSLPAVLATATPAAQATQEKIPEFSKQPGPDLAGSPAVPLLGAVVPTMFFVVAALLFGSLRRPKS